jgi:hypothetical protein
MAMFIALGGLSYAAVQIGTKQITNNSIRSKDIRNGAVATRDIRDSTIGTIDITDAGVGTADLADNAVDTAKIADNAVGSGKLADGGVNNADLSPDVPVVSGFATIDAVAANGSAPVQNSGGAQTSSVTAARVGTGIYDVTFVANAAEFSGVNNVADLTLQVTGRDGFSTGSVFDAASTASEGEVKLRVFMRRPDDGAARDADFSVEFFARP